MAARPVPAAATLLSALGAGVERIAAAAGWRARLLALAAVALCYAATRAGNLIEPDDALAFAWRAEHVPASQVSDPRLMGYHTLARGLWLVANALGVAVDGLQVLRAMSLLGATVGLWLVWRLLVQRLAIARAPALLATAALGCSYGWWRYAAEGDVYVSAMALCAGVLYGLLAPAAGPGWPGAGGHRDRSADSVDSANHGARRPGRAGAGRCAALGALAGLAVLYYQPSTIPLFLAFPWLAWQRHGRGAALAYVAAGAALGGAGYLVGYLVYWPDGLTLPGLRDFLAQRSDEFIVPPLSLRGAATSGVRAALALAHDVTSANFAFGLPPLQNVATRVFGAHTLDEEIYLARQAGAWVWVPLLLLPALALLTWRTWQAGRAAGGHVGGAPAALPWRRRWAVLGRGPWPVLGVWALLTAAVIGRLNPGGTEAWIVFLLPLHLLLAALLWAPACRAGTAGVGVAALCVAALALHNAVGGMALVQSPRHDLLALRSQWLAAQATPADLIVVTDNLPLADHLRWRSRAPVAMLRSQSGYVLAQALALGAGAPVPVLSVGRDLGGVDVMALARRTLAQGGRVLVFDNFFGAALGAAPGGPSNHASTRPSGRPSGHPSGSLSGGPSGGPSGSPSGDWADPRWLSPRQDPVLADLRQRSTLLHPGAPPGAADGWAVRALFAAAVQPAGPP